MGPGKQSTITQSPGQQKIKSMAITTTQHLPAARLRLFRVIALILPILLIVIIELALRLFHYGYDTSVFITSPGDQDYLVFNPNASKEYFTDPLSATTGNREPFRKAKEAGTLRIFVLGESTTIGYPYFHNGSFHRWLQYHLMRTFPGKKFEIINLSLTAINSYTVLGFAREVVKQEPDAVLIYTGHNEYYGALGVGSTDRLGGSPWLIDTLLWLRQWRFIQLLTRIWHTISHLFSGAPPKTGKTRMELMVADQQIAYGSALFNRGIQQFRTNMDETLQLFNRQGIPVFFSNLVSNLKDQRPFISITAAGPDSTDALYNFTLANKAWQRGDYFVAKQNYTLARDMDALRFRAPETINAIIEELCRKYNGNTHLVDTRTAFEAASDHGIIGNTLLLEHVHPNLKGYALMSDAFYRALQQYGIIPPATANDLSFIELLADMPITRVDSLSGAYKILNLKSNWPFNGSDKEGGPPSRQAWHLTTEEGDLAYAVAFEHLSWEEAMRQLYDYYSKTEDWTRAATVMEALCLEHPGEAGFFEKTAMLYGKLNEKEKAILYFRQAFDREPSFDKARYLFVLCLQADRPAEAMPYLDYAIANNTAGMNLQPIRAGAIGILHLEQQLAADSANPRILDSIAITYDRMGNHPAALKYRHQEPLEAARPSLNSKK
jgi:lysophospholipase L1-like esterase